jgi:hypothetical protein
MNGTYRTSSRRRAQPHRRLTRRSGLTLVEVVAGLALLATLLVAVLGTKARVTRQWAHANRKLEAVAAADRLLAAWWATPATFPRKNSGSVPGDAGLNWRTTPVGNDAVRPLGASVVRLEIVDERQPAAAGAVLATVEVVLDDELPRGGVPPAGGGAQ